MYFRVKKCYCQFHISVFLLLDGQTYTVFIKWKLIWYFWFNHWFHKLTYFSNIPKRYCFSILLLKEVKITVQKKNKYKKRETDLIGSLSIVSSLRLMCLTLYFFFFFYFISELTILIVLLFYFFMTVPPSCTNCYGYATSTYTVFEDQVDWKTARVSYVYCCGMQF